jgi:hypothetical protein
MSQFSPETVKLLDEMAKWFRRFKVNSQKRPAIANEQGTAPEVYIARAPSGGIPASDGTTPGSAICDVRYIGPDGKLYLVGTSQTVYNVTDTAVDSSDDVSVHRDKFGKWIASVLGGGGSVPVPSFGRRGDLPYPSGSLGTSQLTILSLNGSPAADAVSGIGTGRIYSVCAAMFDSNLSTSLLQSIGGYVAFVFFDGSGNPLGTNPLKYPLHIQGNQSFCIQAGFKSTDVEAGAVTISPVTVWDGISATKPTGAVISSTFTVSTPIA